jgi:predicted transcriptional regulator
MIDKNHVAMIVSAYARNNKFAADQLPPLIASVHAALAHPEGAGSSEAPVEIVPVVSIRRSVEPNAVVCLECGYRAKMLRRHLERVHGLSADAYRDRWGLKQDHPIVAPAYAAHRRDLAKAIGLGRPKSSMP